MALPLIVLIALLAVVLTGLVAGGLVVSRRRGNRVIPVPPSTPRPAVPRGGGATTLERPPDLVSEAAPDATVLDAAVLDAAVLGEAVLEDEVEAPPTLEDLLRPSFRDRLGKARGLLAGYLGSIRSRRVDQETWDELEEALIRADVGVDVATEILDELRAAARKDGIDDPDRLLETLKSQLKANMADRDRSLRIDEGTTNVWLFVGVNGVGKTTTIGKVGRQQSDLGRKVLMAAGDTFRAAAAEQLEMWAERSGAEFVRGTEGADPSAVVFDSIQRAAARGVPLVLADTAGRLHNKTNLMDELRKVRRVAAKGKGRVTEVLLVIDATTGQNGLTQAREFGDATAVTGVVLTKLDGSAKGGIVFAIETELGLPVKLVGLGETIGDLVPFEPSEFVEALVSLD